MIAKMQGPLSILRAPDHDGCTRPRTSLRLQRRQLLLGALGGAITAAAGASSGWAFLLEPGGAGAAAPMLRQVTVLSDNRLTSSVRWSKTLQSLGSATYDLDHTDDALWSANIGFLLGDKRAPLAAGRTPEALFVCLQHLSAAQWCGLRITIQHRLDRAQMTHHVVAPEALALQLRATLEQGMTNEHALARLFGAASSKKETVGQASFVVRSPREKTRPDIDGTVTWLIAPLRSRV